MIGGSVDSPRFRRTIVACVMVSVLLMLTSCTRNRPSRKEPSAGPPPPSQQVLRAPGGRVEPEPQILADSGKIQWAKGYQGILIAGFDDGLYEPYAHAVIESVQRALWDRGLYNGPVNGILDKPTMEAIYAFQKATRILQRCGIPTPFTRKMLKQGSHTDPAS